MSGDLLGDAAPVVFTDKMKREALERELRLRRRAYPRFVSLGRMVEETAEREIAIFEAILRDGFRP